MRAAQGIPEPKPAPAILASPLARQYLLWTLLFSALLTLLVTGIELGGHYRARAAAIRTEIKELGEGYLRIISVAVWQFNREQVQSALDNLQLNPAVNNASVVGGTMSLHAGPDDASSSFQVELPISYQFGDRTYHLGVLNIRGSFQQIDKEILELLLNRLVSNFAKVVAFAVFSLFVFHRLVNRHLGHISRRVRDTEFLQRKSDLVLDRNKFGYHGTDEIDQVSHAITVMRNDLVEQLAATDTAIADRERQVVEHRGNLNAIAAALRSVDRHVSLFDARGEPLYLQPDPPQDPAIRAVLSTPCFDRASTEALLARHGAVCQQAAGSGSDRRRFIIEAAHADQIWRLTGVLLADGALTIIAENLTDLRRVEDELHRAQKLEALGTLAGGVAHELNNLLAVALGNLSLLQMKQKQGDIDKYSAAIVRALNSAASVTSQLLNYSRQHATERRTLIPVRDLVHAVCDTAMRLNGQGVAIIPQIADDVVGSIRVDEGAISAAVLNLVKNAIEASGGKGSVQIIARRSAPPARPRGIIDHPHWLAIDVVDQGRGIPQTLMHKIFDPFFTTRQNEGGTGLGLWMAFNCVHANDGDIAAVSTAAGSRFTIVLPFNPMQEAVDSEKSDQNGKALGSILIVEDIPELLQLYGQLLEASGFSVREARDIAEARQAMADGTHFDAVLCDQNLPDGDGQEFCRYAKQQNAAIVTVLISGNLRANALDPRLVDLSFTKPVEAEKLSAAIARKIQAAGEPAGMPTAKPADSSRQQPRTGKI